MIHMNMNDQVSWIQGAEQKKKKNESLDGQKIAEQIRLRTTKKRTHEQVKNRVGGKEP